MQNPMPPVQLASLHSSRSTTARSNPPQPALPPSARPQSNSPPPPFPDNPTHNPPAATQPHSVYTRRAFSLISPTAALQNLHTSLTFPHTPENLFPTGPPVTYEYLTGVSPASSTAVFPSSSPPGPALSVHSESSYNTIVQQEFVAQHPRTSGDYRRLLGPGGKSPAADARIVGGEKVGRWERVRRRVRRMVDKVRQRREDREGEEEERIGRGRLGIWYRKDRRDVDGGRDISEGSTGTVKEEETGG